MVTGSNRKMQNLLPRKCHNYNMIYLIVTEEQIINKLIVFYIMQSLQLINYIVSFPSVTVPSVTALNEWCAGCALLCSCTLPVGSSATCEKCY